jgi:hypothetical protein
MGNGNNEISSTASGIESSRAIPVDGIKYSPPINCVSDQGVGLEFPLLFSFLPK